MAVSYKLTYFAIYGRAETARMMFSIAGVKFEDVRIEASTWSTLKPQTPLGFLPILETAKGTITQVTPINMFVAAQTGFLAEDNFDRVQACSILLTVNDLLSHVSSNIFMSEIYKYIPTPDDIEEKRKTAKQEVMKVLKFVEGIAKKGAKFIFGDKMTVADVGLFTAMLGICVAFPEKELENDWFKKFMANMNGDAKVAKYLKERIPSPSGV